MGSGTVDLDLIHEQWATNVRTRREALGLSQVALAERINATQPRISEIERGVHVPGDPLKVRLADALMTTVDALFSYTVAAAT